MLSASHSQEGAELAGGGGDQDSHGPSALPSFLI